MEKGRAHAGRQGEAQVGRAGPRTGGGTAAQAGRQWQAAGPVLDVCGPHVAHTRHTGDNDIDACVLQHGSGIALDGPRFTLAPIPLVTITAS